MFDWFNPRKKYLKGLAAVSGEFLERTMVQRGIEDFVCRDMNYLLLSRNCLRAFLFRYVDNSWFNYHRNSDEFPDCDDMALCARANVVRAASKIGFKYPIAFGGISYFSQRLEGWHRANWTLDSDLKLWIYEPQDKSFHLPHEELGTVEEASI